MLEKSVSSLGEVTYRYDAAGRLGYEKDSLSDRRKYYTYDEDGNLIKTYVAVNSLANTYKSFLFSTENEKTEDENGSVERKGVKGKQYAVDTFYNYNAENVLTGVATTADGTRSLVYTYDDEGRMSKKSVTTDSVVDFEYTYNDDGLISKEVSKRANTSVTFAFTYDDNGNITQIKRGTVVQQRYAYDETSQLVREDNRDTGKTVTYTYDGYGNITSKNEYAFTLGELGAVVDTISYAYDDTAWKDKLTSYDGQSITYDEIGNPTNYRGIAMTWNGRKLMSYNKDGTSISYKYDSNGLRSQKIINGVKHDYYYNEDGQLVYEVKDGVYELYYKYDADGNLFTITRYRYSDGARHVYYAQVNTRGDVTMLRSSNGSIYCTYVYDSWGRLVSATNASGANLGVDTIGYQNSIRYRGYVYDHETGLYYLQSRYYDPEVGRFLNADDVDYIGASGTVLGYNAFAYCENRPVGNSDPSGNIATLSLVAVGAVVGFISSFVLSLLISRALNPLVKGKQLWSGALIDGIAGAISGAFAVLPFGWIIQSIINGIVSGVSYIAYCRINKQTLYKSELSATVLTGLISGALGGNGMLKRVRGQINLSDVIKRANSVISRESRRANVKYAVKSISRVRSWANNLISAAMWKTFSRFAALFSLGKIRGTKYIFS